jgi:hypothetical protein
MREFQWLFVTSLATSLIAVSTIITIIVLIVVC